MNRYRLAPTWLHRDGESRLFETQSAVDAAWVDGWSDKVVARKTGKVAIFKKGRQRALKVCDSQAEADAWILENVKEKDFDKLSFEDRE